MSIEKETKGNIKVYFQGLLLVVKVLFSFTTHTCVKIGLSNRKVQQQTKDEIKTFL